MSTYTDLHNQIKETIVVGYRPDDRMTTQKVKFVNKENEYYGTFKGTIIGENPTFNDGTFNNVDINASTLSGVTLKTTDGHLINIDNIANDIQQMSQDIDSLQTVDKELDTKISTVSSNVGALSSSISKSLSALDNKLLSTQTALSAETLARVSADADIIEQVADISTALSVDITREWSTALFSESELRRAEEAKLNELIADEEESRISADEALSDMLSAAFEDGKHYDLNVIDTTSRPYQAKEFAVNILKAATSDATVYDTDGKAAIGQINGTADGKIELVVNSNVPDKYKSALVAGQTYAFDVGTTSVYTVNGYQLILERADTLDMTKFTLRPAVTSYYPLIWDKAEDEWKNVGLVTDAFADAASGMLISGYVTVDTDDTTISPFKCLYQKFSTTDTPEISVENNIIVYNSRNAFAFEKNMQTKHYLQLLNALSADEMFGKVYEDDVRKDDAGALESIKVKLLDCINKLELNKENGFKSVVSSDVSSVTYLSITDAEEVLEKREAIRWKHEFYVPSDAEKTSYGSVILEKLNTTLSDDFNEPLSVDLQTVEKIPALQKVYELKKNALGKWETAQEIDGHQISVVVDKEAFTLDIKIVTAEVHAIVIKHFDIAEEPTYDAELDFSVEIAKSVPLEYDYPESETAPEAIYEVLVGRRIDVVHPTYVFGCSTEGMADIRIAIPDKRSSSLSREMMFVVNITSKAHKDLALKFIDSNGNDIETYYKRSLQFTVPSNEYSTLMLREAQHDVFMLFDLDENSQDGKIAKIQKEVNELTLSVLALSDTLSTDIQHLSDSLSLDISALSDSISADVRQLSADLSGELSGQIQMLSDSLSIEISTLSTSLSNSIDAICAMLSDDISAVSADVGWLSSQVSTLIDIDSKDVTWCGTLSYVKCAADESLEHLFIEQEFTKHDKSYLFKRGNLYHLSAAQPDLKDSNGDISSFNADDFMLFNDDVILSDVTYDDMSVIRNYDIAISARIEQDQQLSIAIGKLSADLSCEISSRVLALSIALSTDIRTLSADLSCEISSRVQALSDTLSTDIQHLSDSLSLDISALSDSISADVRQLSADLSVDILALSVHLSNDVKLSVSTLVIKDSGQDEDIKFVSSDLSTLEQHYNVTFSSVDRRIDSNISSDNLIVTDTQHGSGEHHTRYYTTFEYGTLVLKKLS